MDRTKVRKYVGAYLESPRVPIQLRARLHACPNGCKGSEPVFEALLPSLQLPVCPPPKAKVSANVCAKPIERPQHALFERLRNMLAGVAPVRPALEPAVNLRPVVDVSVSQNRMRNWLCSVCHAVMPSTFGMKIHMADPPQGLMPGLWNPELFGIVDSSVSIWIPWPPNPPMQHGTPECQSEAFDSKFAEAIENLRTVYKVEPRVVVGELAYGR